MLLPFKYHKQCIQDYPQLQYGTELLEKHIVAVVSTRIEFDEQKGTLLSYSFRLQIDKEYYFDLSTGVNPNYGIKQDASYNLLARQPAGKGRAFNDGDDSSQEALQLLSTLGTFHNLNYTYHFDGFDGFYFPRLSGPLPGPLRKVAGPNSRLVALQSNLLDKFILYETPEQYFLKRANKLNNRKFKICRSGKFSGSNWATSDVSYPSAPAYGVWEKRRSKNGNYSSKRDFRQLKMYFVLPSCLSEKKFRNAFLVHSRPGSESRYKDYITRSRY